MSLTKPSPSCAPLFYLDGSKRLYRPYGRDWLATRYQFIERTPADALPRIFTAFLAEVVPANAEAERWLEEERIESAADQVESAIMHTAKDSR